MKALILAGGYGKRLMPVTQHTPKPLIRLAGKPIIEWQMEWLEGEGVDSFVVLCGYLGHKIMRFIRRTRFGRLTEFSVERAPLGRGGAVKNARELIEPDTEFLVMNGDIISNMRVGSMRLGRYPAAITLVPLRSTYGVVRLRGDAVAGFDVNPLIRGMWLHAGGTLMRSDLVERLPDRGDMEDTLFAELSGTSQLKGVRYNGVYWRSIDSIKDLEEAEKDLKRRVVYK